ncbi:MAG: hypothetical protein KJZ78_15735, partial [Bryobacteraceae bacterium]|nr:hypothetical protein [Bryobacteraceae bacterium]
MRQPPMPSTIKDVARAA